MNNCILLGLCLYCLCQNGRNGRNNDDWGCDGNGRNGRGGNGNWDWNDNEDGRNGRNGGNSRGGRGNDNDGCDCVEPRFEPRFDARPFGNNRETCGCEEKNSEE